MDAVDRLKSFLSDNSLSLKELSEKTGTPYRTVQRYMARDRSLSSDFLQAVTDNLDVSVSWILSGRGQILLEERPNGRRILSDFIPIQRFDIAASAGRGSLAEVEIGTGHYAFNRKWLDRRGLKPDNLAVIAVRGDSMEPELYDEDLILLDRSQKMPRDSDMYVVRYSGELFVKRIQMIPSNRIELLSVNRFYTPITVDLPQDDQSDYLDLEFIGRVVASMHEW